MTRFEQISLAVPTIRVDTTDGYNPGMQDIVAFARRRYSRSHQPPLWNRDPTAGVLPLKMLRRLFVAAALLMAAVGTSTPAHAAAPRLVFVYGDLLAQPVVLDDWWENLALLLGNEGPTEITDLDGRPYLDLAFFWGPAWDQYVRDGQPLEALMPTQANQFGRLYLRSGGLPPLVAVNGVRLKSTPGPMWSVRDLSAEAEAVFERHGISLQTAGQP